MTKIQQDAHGHFVRAGGYLFRPTRPAALRMRPIPLTPGQELFADAPDLEPPGAAVRARHLAGTPFGRVGAEIWFSHGPYYRQDPDAPRTRNLPTTDVYLP